MKDIIETKLAVIPELAQKKTIFIKHFSEKIHLTRCLWSGKRGLINVDTK